MNRDPDRRVPPKRTGFDPSRYDPSKYDMYAAFRTKERAEERAAKQAQRRSLYDVSPQKNRPTGSSGQSGTYGRPGTYGNSGNSRNFSAPGSAAQNRQTTAQNGSRPTGTGVYHINRPPQTQRSGMQPDSRRTQTTQTTQTQFRTQDPARQNTARRTADQKTGKRASAASSPLRGTRVNSAAGDSYRYGYHSSYRTSDGRILDGFDKSGRPIYREDSASGNAPIVRTTSAAPDAAHLHPVRRIRVETLEDTERKPFPFALVLTVFLCTALVMAVLYTYMTLNECTNTLSTLTYRLSNLRAEVNTLSAEVVRREDLIAIEQTAADELGMVKNDVLEKRYVSIENEDKTEVVKKTAPGVKRRVSVEIDLDTGLPAADPDAPDDQ